MKLKQQLISIKSNLYFTINEKNLKDSFLKIKNLKNNHKSEKA